MGEEREAGEGEGERGKREFGCSLGLVGPGTGLSRMRGLVSVSTRDRSVCVSSSESVACVVGVQVVETRMRVETAASQTGVKYHGL